MRKTKKIKKYTEIQKGCYKLRKKTKKAKKKKNEKVKMI